MRKITMTGLLCLLAASAGSAQEVVVVDPVYRYPTRLQWSVYDPVYAVTSRIYAQADLIRAQSDAAVDFAQARNLHASAYSKELDNWKKELRTYWERKTIAEQEKVKLDHQHQIGRMKYLNDQKWQNNRLWDRLKNHPELSGPNIRNGSALNFMLARLAASSLPYQFDAESSRFGKEALRQLKLDDEWLSHLTLKQGTFQFSASQTVNDSINSWPYILRWEDFRASRAAFEQARAAVVTESEKKGQASVESIQRLEAALMKLTSEYHGSTKVAEWVKQRNRYSHFYAGDRFLKDLDREILQLEKTGDIRPFRGQSGYDPQADGEHVVSLLCFMNRNGVEFAAAKPGSEFAYHKLFVLMRGFYLTVAEDDDALSPLDLRNRD